MRDPYIRLNCTCSQTFLRLIYMRAGIPVAIRVGRGRENNFEKGLQTLLPLLLPIVLLCFNKKYIIQCTMATNQILENVLRTEIEKTDNI